MADGNGVLKGVSAGTGVGGFRRASNATYVDASGVLQTVGNDTLRSGYDPVTLNSLGLILEGASTNSIRNPRGEGAVVASPGTLPTNWNVPNAAGLTRQVVGTGFEDGIPYVDVRYSGTSNATLWQILPEATTIGIPALSGQQWTSSVFLRLVGGSYTNFPTTSGTCLEIVFYSSAGGALVTGGSTSDPAPLPTTGPLRTQRYAVSFIPTNASIAYTPGIVIRFNIATASAIDFTIRIGAPQTEFITSSPTNYMGLFGNGWTWAAIVQQNFQPDPLGTSRAIFLTDTNVSSTHFITQASGTVANNQPLTYSVYVKDGGRRYMRFQIFDTSSSGNQMNVYFDCLTGVITVAAAIIGLGTNVSAGIVPVGGGWFRAWITGTLSTTADTTVSCRIFLYNAASGNGTYADGTGLGLYLWGQQLEAASSPGPLVNLDATSVILPAIGSPAASSRAADILSPIQTTTFAGVASTTGIPDLISTSGISVFGVAGIAAAGSPLEEVDAPFSGVAATGIAGSPRFDKTLTLTGVATSGWVGGFSRASSANYHDASGVLQSAGINLMRPWYDPVTNNNAGILIEPASTNYTRNPRAEGAVNGSPGTLPTNWSIPNGLGLTRTIVGTGTEDGIPYIDIRFNGTSTAAVFQMQTDTSTGISAALGQSWVTSVYIRLVAGTTTSFVAISLAQYFNDSGGTNLTIAGNNADATSLPTSAPLRTQRYVGSAFATNASTATTNGVGIRLVVTTSQPYDFTLRIGAPQAELVSSTPINLMPLFGNTWTNSQTAATSFQPDPVGTSRAVFVTDTAVSGNHFFQSISGTIPNNQPATFSVYMKDGGRRYCRPQIFDSTTTTNQTAFTVDLQTGTVTSNPNVGGLATNLSASITAVGNGWYRVSVTATLSATADTTITARLFLSNNSGTSPNYADGTGKGLYFWGAQIQTGPLSNYVSNDSTTPMLPPVGTPGISSRAADIMLDAVSIGEIGTGVASQAIVGSLAARFSASNIISGVAATGAANSPLLFVSQPLAGVASTTAIGSITVPAAAGVAATGSATSLGGGAFSRSSTATYFDAAGVMQTAANNVLRPRYDPNTHAVLGYLEETAATNIIGWSTAVQSGNWSTNATPNDCTMVPNAATAPDGTLNASNLVPTTTSGSHTVYRTHGFGAINTTYTASSYAKANGYHIVQFNLGNTAYPATSAFFDLNAGTIYSISGACSATITPIGNGWYRLTHTVTSNGNGGAYVVGWTPLNNAGVVSFAGDGTSGILVWGCQVELGTAASSFIYTTSAAAATRAADVVSTAGIAVIAPSITGVAATGQAGLVGCQYDDTISIIGIASATSAGTLAIRVDDIASITGVSNSGQVGGLTTRVDDTVPLTGNAGASQVGSLTTRVDDSTSLIGNSIASQVGSLAIQNQEVLSGAATSGQVGVLTPFTSRVLIGSVGIGQRGSLLTQVQEPLLGVASSANIGTLLVQAGTSTTAAIVGVSSSAATTAMLAPVTEPLAGVSAVGAATDMLGGVFLRQTQATYFDSAGTVQFADPNVLRYGYDPVTLLPIGNLYEGASTNWVRNPRGEGLVSTVFGFLPTNWQVTNTGNVLTWVVVGTGIEDGIPYTDIRYNGTTNGNFGINTESVSGIPVQTGQLWAVSAYLRVVAGTIPPPVTAGIGIYTYDSSGAFVAGYGPNQGQVAPTSAPLRTQRFIGVGQIANVTAVYGGGARIGLQMAAGAVDFTLRIGAPQAELISNNYAFPAMGAWTPSQTTYSYNQPDPFSQSRAMLVLDTTVSGPHHVYFLTVAPLLLNQQNTFSFYVKDAGKRYLGIYFLDQVTQGNSATVHMDLQTGTIAVGPTAAGAVTGISASITPVGTSGWYRCAISATHSASTTPSTFICRIYLEQTPGSTANYVGNGTGIYLWGSQLQIGPLTDFINNEPTSLMLPSIGNPVVSSRATDIITQFVQITDPLVGVSAGGAAADMTGGVFLRQSQATYFDSTGTLQIADPNVLRSGYDPVTLLPTGNQYEPASTNWVRNARGEGSVVTALGLMPINWAVTNTGASTWAVIGSGVEDGIPYADIRVSGTTNGNFGIQFESTTGIPASLNQQWSGSVYVRLVAGTFSATTCGLSIYGYNSSGASAVVYGGALTAWTFPTSAPLRTQRYTVAGIVTNAATAYVAPRFGIALTAGPIDITIRFGAPQCELLSGQNLGWLLNNGYAGNTIINITYWQPDPYGLSRSILLVDTTANGQHFTNASSQTISPNQQLTFSVYVKDQGRRYIYVTIYDWSQATNYITAFFDLQTGTVISASNGGNGFGVTATITPVTDATTSGWYRVAVSGTPTTNVGDTLTLVRIWLIQSPPGTTYIGNGTGVYLYGACLQVGPLTDYINNDATSIILPPSGSPGVSNRAADIITQFIQITDPLVGVSATGWAQEDSRASSATYFDVTGTLQTVGPNVPRYGAYDFNTMQPIGLLVEPAGSNGITNPRAENAVVGTIGSGGVWPTGWNTLGGTAGQTIQILAAGYLPNGLPYIDVRVSGTPIGASQFTIITFQSGSSLTVNPGDVRTESIFVALTGGSLANVSFVQVNLRWNSGQTSLNFTPTSTLTRYSVTATVPPTGVTYSNPSFTILYPASPGPIDYTMRIAGPQFEPGSFATSLILPPVGVRGVSTRAADSTLPIVASQPTGVASTAAIGSIRGSVVIPVSLSVGATSGVGSLAVRVDDSATLTAVITTGAPGTLAIRVDETVALTGVMTTGALGSVATRDGASIAGLSSSGNVGTLQASVTTKITTNTAAVWNPASLAFPAQTVLSNDNRTITNGATTGHYEGARATVLCSSGKFYAEFTPGSIWDGFCGFGIADTRATYLSLITDATDGCIFYPGYGVWLNHSATGILESTWTNQTAAMAVDLDNHRIWFRVLPSGFWNGDSSANPTLPSTGLDISTIPVQILQPVVTISTFGAGGTINCGTVPFLGIVPTGYIGWQAQAVAGAVTTRVDDSAALVGLASSGSAGSPTTRVDDTPVITGTFATGVAGAVTTRVDATTSITGNATVGLTGIPLSSVAAKLGGAQSTAQAGTLGPREDGRLIGTIASGLIGSPTPSLTVPVNGVATIGQAGSTTPREDGKLFGVAGSSAAGSLATALSISLGSVSATGAAGLLIGAVTLGGVASSASAGQLRPSIVATLVGSAASAVAGTLTTALTITFNGATAIGQAGLPIPRYDQTSVLIGVGGSLGLGTLVQAVQPTAFGVASVGGSGNFALATTIVLQGAKTDATAGNATASAASLDYSAISLSGLVSIGTAGTPHTKIDTPIISGVSSIAKVGTVIPAVAYSIGGVQAGGQASGFALTSRVSILGALSDTRIGSLALEIDVASIGISGTGDVGILTTRIQQSIIGAESSGQAGDLPAASVVTVQGVSSAGQVGELARRIAANIGGVEADTAVGDVAATTGLIWPITGVISQAQFGAIQVEIAAAPSSAVAVGQVGIASVVGVKQQPLIGVEGSAQTRDLSGAIAVAPIGSSADAFAGKLALVPSGILAGAEAAAVAGDVTATTGMVQPIDGAASHAQATDVQTALAASLSGVVAIGQAGDPYLIGIKEQPLTGVESSAQFGGLSDEIVIAPLGTLATADLGDLALDSSITLVGVEAGTAVGEVIGTAAQLQPIDGAASQAFCGEVLIASELKLSGATAAGQAGRLSVTGAQQQPLVGVGSSGQAGDVSDAIAVALNGISAATDVGNLARVSNVEVSGVEATAAIGDLTAVPVLTGTVTAGQAGTLEIAIDSTLVGVAAIGQITTVPAVPSGTISGVEGASDAASLAVLVGAEIEGVAGEGIAGETVITGTNITTGASIDGVESGGAAGDLTIGKAAPQLRSGGGQTRFRHRLFSVPPPRETPQEALVRWRKLVDELLELPPRQEKGTEQPEPDEAYAFITSLPIKPPVEPFEPTDPWMVLAAAEDAMLLGDDDLLGEEEFLLGELLEIA